MNKAEAIKILKKERYDLEATEHEGKKFLKALDLAIEVLEHYVRTSTNEITQKGDKTNGNFTDGL